MSTYTPNLNLKKPSGNEYYDVVAEDNDAKDKIDLEVGSLRIQLGESAKASRYGVNENIGNGDATTLLNNYFTTLKSKGIKYAYFDKPHTYKVSGILDKARDLILIGNAKIDSSNIANYFINICPTIETYNGKYNSLPFSQTSLKQFGKAILGNRNIVVGIIGDSISTGGEDCLNISYNNINGANSSMEMGPNSLTPGDSYYQRLMDMITTEFKDKTFDIYNRAIGGSVIQQWNANKEFGGVTKAWIDHLKDTKCDLLLVGWGMNQTTYAIAQEYKYFLKLLIDYVNTNFNPIPTIALVTSPRPYLALEDVWGSVENQQAIDMSAYATRTYGKERGCYIIDANKISNIKRVGKTFENPSMKTIGQNYAEIESILSGTYTKDGYTYKVQTATTELILPVKEKSFVVAFDVSFTGFPVGVENLHIQYNYGDLVKNLLMLKPNEAGVAVLDSFSNMSDVAHFLSPSKSFLPGITWNDGIFRRIAIERRDDVLDVFVDGHRVLRDRVQICDFPGEIRLTKNAGGVGVVTIQNIALYKGEFKQYLPTLTETEMWGTHVNGEYGTKSPIGGNGVNHPSTLGLEEVYVPVLKEFIEDLSEATQSVDKGVYVPTNIPLVEPAGTATSGAALGYFNAPLFTDFPSWSKLQNVDGTYWTKRSDITSFSGASALLNGEFAIYNDGAVTQVALAKTTIAEIALPLKLWSWLNV